MTPGRPRIPLIGATNWAGGGLMATEHLIGIGRRRTTSLVVRSS